MDVLKDFVSPFAQIVSAVAIGLGYVLLIKNQRKMIRDRQEARTAGGRPLVVVTVDHSHLPETYVVVRNFTEAPAEDITFDFSAPVEKMSEDDDIGGQNSHQRATSSKEGQGKAH